METTKEHLREILDDGTNDACLPSKSVVLAHFDQLAADARRLNGVRMVICEQDKALRERMGEAMATVFEAWVDTLTRETIVAPEAFNAMVDAALLAACEARK